MKALDVVSLYRATQGVELTAESPSVASFIRGKTHGPLVLGGETYGSFVPQELDGLICHLGGQPYFTDMPKGSLGFVTSATYSVPLVGGSNAFLVEGDQPSLMVCHPSVHVYRAAGELVALMYTNDGGILWVTQSVDGDECELYQRAKLVMSKVHDQLRRIPGDRKETGAIKRWQSVSFPLIGGVFWQPLDWMKGVTAHTLAGPVDVAGVLQRFELIFNLDGFATRPREVAVPQSSHFTLGGKMLMFQTRPNYQTGPDAPPFLLEWLCATEADRNTA